MLATFEKGSIPRKTADELKLLVSREVPLEEVRNAIESPLYDGLFITITGELCCGRRRPQRRVSALPLSILVFVFTLGPKCAGKSVLVEWACGDIGQVREGTSFELSCALKSSNHNALFFPFSQGVIHVTVESAAAAGNMQGIFASALAKEINFKETVKGIKLSKACEERTPHSFCGLLCPSGDWISVCEAFKLGAMAFAAKHKRLPALVIDGAEFLMKDVQFVDELVDLAKVCLKPYRQSTFVLIPPLFVLVVAADRRRGLTRVSHASCLSPALEIS